MWLLLIAGAAVGAALVPVDRLFAFPSYGNAWAAKYPTSTLPLRMDALTGSDCNVCHIPSGFGDDGTCYKVDLLDRLNQGMTIQQAIDAVDGIDSDSDGVPNGIEILTVRLDNPAHRGYHPGLIGPTGTSPCGPNPSLAITNQLETPPTCYPDCNGDSLLNLADFGCFQTKFALGDPYADCNGDSLLNLADFGCFQTKFALGCP